MSPSPKNGTTRGSIDYLVAGVHFFRDRPNLVRAIAVVTFFVFWELTARDMNPLLMTYPTAVFKAAWTIIISGELFEAFVQSMTVFVIGMSISIVGGIVIGVMVGQWWFFENTLDPFINALYAVPRIALVPLIMLWVGLQDMGKITILVSIAIFPVIINTYSGIKDVRGSLLEIGRAFGASESQIFFRITLPAAVPFVMTGIRLAIGLGIIGMIVAEFFFRYQRARGPDHQLCQRIPNRQGVRADHRVGPDGRRPYRARPIRRAPAVQMAHPRARAHRVSEPAEVRVIVDPAAPSATSRVMCQGERGAYSLCFVFVDEDGEEDAVH